MSDDVSRKLKEMAEGQQIRVELTEEQMKALIHQWNAGDPKRPARITFEVGDKAIAELNVAAYRYVGDTCCV